MAYQAPPENEVFKIISIYYDQMFIIAWMGMLLWSYVAYCLKIQFRPREAFKLNYWLTVKRSVSLQHIQF